jgi:hypothetical protein
MEVHVGNAQSQPQRGCVNSQWALHPTNVEGDTTPLGLETFACIVSQGSRGGNPGLEDITPLGLVPGKNDRIRESHLFSGGFPG